SQRRGVFPGPSRQSGCRPVHEPPDAAPRRLFDRAQPAHQRCRWRFPRRRGGSIRFTYFHDLFGRLTLNPGDTITVLRRDRTIIMRTPFDLDVIGKNLAERPKWRANNLKEGTAYAGVGPVDPTPRLYVRSGRTSLFFG